MNLFKLLFFLTLISTTLDAANSLTLSGNPSSFTISTATAGSNPPAVTNTSTTYSVSTVGTLTISGAINANLPTGTSLQVSLAAPSGGTSQGLQTMSTTSQNLVTNVKAVSKVSGLAITYQLTATADAAPVTNKTVTLTYTMQ